MQIRLESTPEREQALFSVVATTNLPALANLLNIGTNPNAIATDQTNRTPLHVAAQHGNAGFVLHLLEAGANVNAVDALGATPLHYAAQYNELATRLLIDRGANVYAVDRENATPLHRAAKKDVPGCVKALVEAGADVNANQRSDYTNPLHWAATEGHARACEVLLAAGARVNAFDVCNRTALHHAAMNGHLDACKALVAGGADPDFMRDEVLGKYCARSPLQSAVVAGRAQVVEYFLLTCGADHQLKSLEGEALTVLARGRQAILRMLRSLEAQALVSGEVDSGADGVQQESPASFKGMSPL